MQGKNILLTGAAGFIGSNMAELLVNDNIVTGIDNLSGTDGRFVKPLLDNKNFRFLKGDITREEDLSSLGKFDLVIHLAANSDVRYGSERPLVDLNSNVIGTVNLLEMMRKNDIPEMVFASSSTVYGEATVLPTPEEYGPYLPISSYGASKMSCEGFISSYSHYYGFRGSIFRFANIVGKNSTHGVIFDFIRKLKNNSRELEILGDGSQRKSYMHVSDCISSILFIHEKLQKTDIYNLGNKETTSVVKIADLIVTKMGLRNVNYRFTGGIDGRGWKGDVKLAQLSIEKLLSKGWKNRYNSDESVALAIDEALAQV